MTLKRFSVREIADDFCVFEDARYIAKCANKPAAEIVATAMETYFKYNTINVMRALQRIQAALSEARIENVGQSPYSEMEIAVSAVNKIERVILEVL